MRLELPWGTQLYALDVDEQRLVKSHRQALVAPVANPALAMADALEHPFGFPALRLALIPDDHVAIAVDEKLPHLTELLVPLLEHVQNAGIVPQAITLLCLPPSTNQPWLEALPDAFQDVHVEIHDPAERRQLSYLATTRRGRRIYLNRSAVDADQLILLTGRGYDSFSGYAGGPCALFPALGDESIRTATGSEPSFEAPGAQPWPLQQEAVEVGWYLGAPFLVQVIVGSGEDIAGIVAGPIESSGEGQKILDDRWRVEVDEPADVVVATISGPAGHDPFLDLARAFACAARVVKPQGRVVVLSAANPTLGRAAEIMRTTEDPGRTLLVLADEKPVDHEAGFLWARAAQEAKLYLLSQIPVEIAEELFVTPLTSPHQVQRIMGENNSVLFLADAHKTLAVLKKPR